MNLDTWLQNGKHQPIRFGFPYIKYNWNEWQSIFDSLLKFLKKKSNHFSVAIVEFMFAIWIQMSITLIKLVLLITSFSFIKILTSSSSFFHPFISSFSTFMKICVRLTWICSNCKTFPVFSRKFFPLHIFFLFCILFLQFLPKHSINGFNVRI